MKTYYVYIITNKSNTTLYTGITNNLDRRVSEHKLHIYKKSFSAMYNLDKLVYYEIFNDPVTAIAREKQLKAGPRKRKVLLINDFNPTWQDLGSEY